MQVEELRALAKTALEDIKAVELCELDVRSLSSVMDYLIIVSGTSNRHVKSLADNLLEKIQQNKAQVFGVEGHNEGEWVLVDLGDIVVHIMQPDVRAFYNLEKLWDGELVQAEQSAVDQSH